MAAPRAEFEMSVHAHQHEEGYLTKVIEHYTSMIPSGVYLSGAFAAIGLSLGLLTGICGVIGTFGGGWQATYMARGGNHRMLLLPMFGAIASVPLFAIAFMGTDWARVELLLAFPLILGGLWTAPSIALTQNLAPVTMRAQASAIYVIGANLIGVSTGPLAVGLTSDLFATYTHSSVTGLRLALIAVAFVLLWGAVHHFLAIRYIRHEQMGVI